MRGQNEDVLKGLQRLLETLKKGLFRYPSSRRIMPCSDGVMFSVRGLRDIPLIRQGIESVPAVERIKLATSRERCAEDSRNLRLCRVVVADAPGDRSDIHALLGRRCVQNLQQYGALEDAQLGIWVAS